MQHKVGLLCLLFFLMGVRLEMGHTTEHTHGTADMPERSVAFRQRSGIVFVSVSVLAHV